MKKIKMFILFIGIGLTSFAQNLSFFDVRPKRDSIQNTSISEYQINSEKDLYVLLSPKFSLQDELSRLAPQLKKEELTTKGNYSFNFLIDGKVAYSENLHPGAMLLADKISNRPIDIVLISNSRSGIWSMNTWDRFISKIGTDVFDSKKKKLTLQIKVYINDKELIYSPVIAEQSVYISKLEKYFDPILYQPQKIVEQSGFQISSANYDKNLITKLNIKIADKTYRKINGIVMLKEGKLLLEQYYDGENRETLHNPRSVSKSMTGTLLGMAIEDGFIKSDQELLGSFYPLKTFKNYSPQKDSVKLSHLLTMSSAFDGNDAIASSPGNEENMYPTSDYTKFALDLPMDSTRKNGESWSYFTAGTMLLADILDRNLPEGLEKYANRKLFKPLDIQSFEWSRTPQGKPFGGGGLRLRALDFAKYGLLYSNLGIYNKNRVLSKAWIKKSLYPHLPLPADRAGFYGYLFWNRTFKVGNKVYQAYYATGNGGNKIYVFQDIPLVIVITASAYGSSYAHQQADEIVENYLLPSIH